MAQKKVVLISAVFLLASFLWPMARDYKELHEFADPGMVQGLFNLFLVFPLYFIPFMIYAYIKPNNLISKAIDSIPLKYVQLGIVAVLLVFIGLTLAKVTGFWWTWLTVGVHSCTVLLVTTLLKDKLKLHESIILAIGFVSINMGLWEIPYQAGLAYIKESAWVQGAALHKLFFRELMIELPFVIGGAAIVAFYNSHHKVLQFNQYFWLGVAVFVGLYILWFATGFWVELVYDWDNMRWIQYEPDYGAKIIFRASKAALAVLPALLLVRWQRARN